MNLHLLFRPLYMFSDLLFMLDAICITVFHKINDTLVMIHFIQRLQNQLTVRFHIKEIWIKVARYSKHWEEYRDQITGALSEAFDLDCSSLFNDMQCNISMNPIEPRFLEERTFDVFYQNSERRAIGTAIHESYTQTPDLKPLIPY